MHYNQLGVVALQCPEFSTRSLGIYSADIDCRRDYLAIKFGHIPNNKSRWGSKALDR